MYYSLAVRWRYLVSHRVGPSEHSDQNLVCHISLPQLITALAETRIAADLELPEPAVCHQPRLHTHTHTHTAAGSCNREISGYSASEGQI
jgi:hypothetical protein